MGRFRTFAPSEFDGTPAGIRRKADREKLIGKRVGYDLERSCMSHVGVVTGAGGRGTIEIGHNAVALTSITQMVVLNDQTYQGKWRK